MGWVPYYPSHPDYLLGRGNAGYFAILSFDWWSLEELCPSAYSNRFETFQHNLIASSIHEIHACLLIGPIWILVGGLLKNVPHLRTL